MRTPYFDHFFERIAREIPSASPLVCYTHMRNAWDFSTAPGLFESKVLCQAEADWDQSWAARRRDWATGESAIEILRQHHPAAILCMHYSDPGRWRVMRWCKKQRIPLFVWTDVNARGLGAPTGLRERAKAAYLQWIDRQAAGWLVPGSAGEAYLQRYSIPISRTFRSPPEPDYAALAAANDHAIRPDQATIGLRPGRHRIVCMGRLVPNKRFDAVINAFIDLADRRPDWDLLVIGDGPTMVDLRALVPQRFMERVFFPGFIRHPQELWAIFRNCHVLAHLADHEPWGVIINEAAACGLAMVCTDVVGAAAELVRDGYNGRIVPRNDPAAAVNALLEVTDPQRLPSYRQHAPLVLANWRQHADPVEGLKKALHAASIAF